MRSVYGVVYFYAFEVQLKFQWTYDRPNRLNYATARRISRLWNAGSPSARPKCNFAVKRSAVGISEWFGAANNVRTLRQDGMADDPTTARRRWPHTLLDTRNGTPTQSAE